MLDEETKARIRAEEEAKVQERLRLEAEQARVEAEQHYRTQVASELRRSRNRRFAWWGLGLLSVLVVLGVMLIRRPLPGAAPPNDGWGGIETTALIERCKEGVRNQLNDVSAEFPSDTEARAQVSVSNDGKRWDGWAICPLLPGRPRIDFSCQYTPQTDNLSLEIIKP